jgi:serine/threonine protein kinase
MFCDSNDVTEELAEPISPMSEKKLVRASSKKKSLVEAATQQSATLYIQTELCNKYTLESWIGERNAVIESNGTTCTELAQWNSGASEIFSQCVDAVSHLHKFGCMHRDIKPSNIFFGSDGSVQIGDFGLAKTADTKEEITLPQVEDVLPTSSNPTSMMHTGRLGTPTYASPEQLLGGDYDVKVDVYALGVILFELLCPMQTKMERAVVLEKFRNGRCLPEEVQANFPTAARLAVAMTELDTKERPTLHTVSKIMPKVLSEMRQHACSVCMAAAPQIEEVMQIEGDEEQVVPIVRWPQPQDGFDSLVAPSCDTEAVDAAPEVLSPYRQQVVQEKCAQAKCVQGSVETLDPIQLYSQKGEYEPDCKSTERSIKKHARPYKDNSSTRLDLPLFLLFLLVDKMGDMGSGMSTSTIRISFGQPVALATMELATFDFAQPDDEIVNVLALETNGEYEYMDVYKAASAIRMACNAQQKGKGTDDSLGAADSSSSWDHPKQSAQPWQQQPLSNIFANVLSSIMSRCTASVK